MDEVGGHECHSFAFILNTIFVLSGTPFVKMTVTGADTRFENDRLRVMNPLNFFRSGILNQASESRFKSASEKS